MPEIVVGFDDSPGAQDAIAFAAMLASATGASLRLVSAFPYDDVPSRATNGVYREFLRQDSQAALDKAAATITAAETVTNAIADTSPPRAIHDVAERTGAALVVVGSTRRGPIGRVVLGSTGERLLHGSPCPVAVVPRGYSDAGAIGKVGVGYDGSEESEPALTAACQAARCFDAGLRVIRVYDATRFGAPALMTVPGEGAYHEDYEAQQRQGLDEAVAALPADLHAETVFVAGSAGHELAAQTEAVDLMVVGSRGYGPRAAVMLGGVTHTVIRKAHCPVIVLPRGSRGLEPLFAGVADATAA